MPLLTTIAVAGCGAPRLAADRDHPGGIVDSDDRCGVLPRECLAGFDPRDDDGCPDPPPPQLRVPPGGGGLDDEAVRVLAAVASDARRLAADARLILIVEHAPDDAADAIERRGAAAKDALVSRGVPAARIAVEPVAADGAGARVVVVIAGCAHGVGLPDVDGDGIPDHRDACPDDPEDLDGHLDDDGCPDLDHDCHPVDPATADGTCGDRDHDGVLDDADACADRPGPPARSGCPHPRASLP